MNPPPDTPDDSAQETQRIRADAPAPAGVPTAPMPPRPAPALTSLGPYVDLSEIGRGGMGVVYRARDTRLGRDVALKVLVAGEHASTEALERFRLEAAVVARMGKHPHVVQVHDFGSEGALHYFTMDLVEGTSLRGWLRERRAPRQVMDLAHKVALGLAHAHAHGVVHRDLKADNVLVDARGEPQVTDFGLAREVDASARLSLTGQVMGTPAYMAPEQAAGRRDEIGPWTDVYAFGAMLYEAFAGAPPHVETELGPLLYAIQRTDARPLRRAAPSVSTEIETIVMKCLEKRPDRRYRDGASLAAEVARYLAGEPIEAKPIGALSRAVRRVRRNLAVSSLLAAVVLLGAGAAGIAGWASWSRSQADRRERDLVDGYLRELARSGKALVEAALARRSVADLDGMRAFEAELEAPVSELKRRAPDLAEPWYHEGRMKRAQGRFAEAESCQEEAVRRAGASGASEGSRAILGEALYERGVLRAQRYQTEREDRRAELLRARAAGRAPDEPPPAQPSTAEVLGARPELVVLRDAALADLDGFLRHGGSGPRAEVARAVACVVRAETLATGDQDAAAKEASEGLGRAIREDRFLTETYQILAGLHESRGEWQEAEKAYVAGNAQDRGYLPFYRGAATAMSQQGLVEEERGGDWLAPRRRGLEWTERLLALAPDDAPAWTLAADLHCAIAVSRSRADDDPTEEIASAVDACEEALERDPSSGDALRLRASLCVRRGEQLARRDEDPTALYREAIERYGKAIAASTDDPDAVDGRATARVQLGNWIRGHVGDPMPCYGEAIREHQGVLERYPRATVAMEHLAEAYLDVGSWKLRNKEDPGEWYTRGLAEYERALALAPHDTGALFGIASAHDAIALWQETRRLDATEEYLAAKEWYGKLIDVAPGDVPAFLGLALVEQSLADMQVARGEDPTEGYRRAIGQYEALVRLRPQSEDRVEDLSGTWERLACWQRDHGQDPQEAIRACVEAAERALALGPGRVGPTKRLASAVGMLADDLARRGEDPWKTYARAVGLYEKAVALDPGDGVSLLSIAVLHRSEAEWLASRKEDPSEALRKSIEAYGRRIALTPDRGALYGCLGEVYRTLGEWQEAHGGDLEETCRRALENFEKDVALDPSDRAADLDRIRMRLRLGDLASARGKEGSAEYEAALTACDAAISRDPGSGSAQRYRGRALEKLGRAADAVAAYREAVRLLPGRRDVVQGLAWAQVASQGDAAPAWQRDTLAAARRLHDGDCRGGRELLERAVAGFEAEVGGLDDPVVRYLAGNAYYNLACVLALASDGESERRGERAAVAPEEEARLRAEALSRLARVVEMGEADRRLIEKDPDLDAIRSDPEFAKILERLPK